MLGPVSPPLTSAKSVVSTPVTVLLKVTVQLTLAAFVGLAAALTIDSTVGAALSKIVPTPWPSAIVMPFPPLGVGFERLRANVSSGSAAVSPQTVTDTVCGGLFWTQVSVPLLLM